MNLRQAELLQKQNFTKGHSWTTLHFINFHPGTERYDGHGIGVFRM